MSWINFDGLCYAQRCAAAVQVSLVGRSPHRDQLPVVLRHPGPLLEGGVPATITSLVENRA